MAKHKGKMDKAENKMHEMKGRTEQKMKDMKKKITKEDENMS